MNIKISKCKSCQRCCHGTPGQKIAAKLDVSGTSPKIIHNGNCEQLARSGACKLGSYKPTECSLYPVILKSDGLYVDTNCPGYEEAIEIIKKLIDKFEQYEQKLELVKI